MITREVDEKERYERRRRLPSFTFHLRWLLLADKTTHANKEEGYRYEVTAREVLSTI